MRFPPPAGKGKVWVDEHYSCAIATRLAPCKVHAATTPVAKAKAVKNSTELEGMRCAGPALLGACLQAAVRWPLLLFISSLADPLPCRRCHVHDAVALCSYFCWLEEALASPELAKTLTEVKVADKLEALRKEQPDFVSLSFDTISSIGANGAIIHYHPSQLRAAGRKRRDGACRAAPVLFTWFTPWPCPCSPRQCRTRATRWIPSVSTSATVGRNTSLAPRT